MSETFLLPGAGRTLLQAITGKFASSAIDSFLTVCGASAVEDASVSDSQSMINRGQNAVSVLCQSIEKMMLLTSLLSAMLPTWRDLVKDHVEMQCGDARCPRTV